MSGPGAEVMPSTSAATAAASYAASDPLENTTSITTGNSLSSTARYSLPFRVLPNFVSAGPRYIVKLVGLESIVSRVLGESDAGLGNNVSAAAQTAGEAAGEGVAEAAVQESGFHIADIFHAMRRFSGFFSYMTSRWSLACFTVVSRPSRFILPL